MAGKLGVDPHSLPELMPPSLVRLFAHDIVLDFAPRDGAPGPGVDPDFGGAEDFGGVGEGAIRPGRPLAVRHALHSSSNSLQLLSN